MQMKKKISIKRVIVGLLVSLFPVGILYLFLIGYIGPPKTFQFQKIEEWNSPDGNEKIVSYTRLTYPRSEILDPSGIVRIERINENETVEAAFEFTLREIDEYRGLKIEWKDGIPLLLTPEYGWPNGTHNLPLKTKSNDQILTDKD